MIVWIMMEDDKFKQKYTEEWRGEMDVLPAIGDHVCLPGIDANIQEQGFSACKAVVRDREFHLPGEDDEMPDVFVDCVIEWQPAYSAPQ